MAKKEDITPIDKLGQAEFQEPTHSDECLVEFVTGHIEKWRDYRDTNFIDAWEEYERIFRGQWAAEDKTRESERSRIISPATQQAVETRHAEVMEAIFGQGEYFDIKDDIRDVNGTPLDVEMLKQQMMEDFAKDKIRKSIDQIELMAEIYGTGIGEIVVKEKTEYIPSTQPIPGVQGQAAIGVMESKRIAVEIVPINPKNFLFDPNGTTVEDCMGVAIEKPVSFFKIVEGMEKGIYRKVELSPVPADADLIESGEDETTYQDGQVTLLTYYGLVPREYLEQLENEGGEVADLFPDDSPQDEYSDLVEAIVVIANGTTLLKAEANPYMMKDRPIIAYQDDTVPNRFLGRGTVEKAYNMQKAIDAQLRSQLDAMALTTAPMMAMDATRMPRGSKFEVKPGKAILVNGNPAEILFPFKFGQTTADNATAAQNFERMLLQATGTLDSQGLMTNVSRDAGQGGMSAAMGTIIKKYRRTLTNFQEDFLMPFIKKAAFRFMQFDPERYPSVDLNFVPTASMGIMAREYEQQQLIGLLQTLGPNTPVLPLILKGILHNSSLSNRGELMEALDKMSQPDPHQQELQQQQQILQLQGLQAQIQLADSQSKQNMADAQKTMIEAQLKPKEVEAKIASALTQNLPNNDELASREFDRRVKIAELQLKEADIKNKSKIVEMQMQDSKHKLGGMEEDFLTKLQEKLNNGH
jgi:hypothetical protein